MWDISKIDWEEQWATHAPGFREGRAHVPLANGEELSLLPGPGFGDCSHPTTKLMLTLLAEVIKNSNPPVFDIGCGSGILSLAAAKMGAKKVYACDIDPEAVNHARKNGVLNEVDIHFAPPPPLSKKPVILINMIASEQKQAWNTHARPFERLIASGILATEKETYLTFAQTNHWQLLHEQENMGWLGFIFKEKPCHAAFSFAFQEGAAGKGGIYPTTFFMATGFHGAHVIIGTTFLIVCFFRAKANHFKPTHHFGFEAAAWYWHFVDVVWLFLFVCIYWWGSGNAPVH